MKITITILALIGLITTASAAGYGYEDSNYVYSFEIEASGEDLEEGPPASVPFGDFLLIQALSRVARFEAEVFYVDEDGNEVWLDNVGQTITSFSSIRELSYQIRGEEFDFEIDPRREIHIQAFLRDENGERMFDAHKSFFLDVFRDDDGKPSHYGLPAGASDIYFNISDVSIEIAGVDEAIIISDGQSYDLDVDDGVVVLPGFVFHDKTWHTLRLEFEDGTVVDYDRLGQIVVQEDVDYYELWHLSIGNILRMGTENSRLTYDWAEPYNGNTTVEVYNEKAGDVTFNIHPYRNTYNRPGHIWLTTMDEFRQFGMKAFEVQSERPSMYWWYGDSPNTEFYLEEDTTYYMVIEWRDASKIMPRYYFSHIGGKG